MKRTVNAPDTEPEESNFKLPSQKEHLFQITEYWEDKKDSDVQIVRLEVVGGEEEGLSILHRVNINDQLKSFYYCRMFLKAISEPYKGDFDIIPDNWCGKQFYATVIHNGKYANIDTYNFEKKIEQVVISRETSKPKEGEEIAWDS